MDLYVNENYGTRTIDVWLVDHLNHTDEFYTTHSDDPSFQGITVHSDDKYIRTGGIDPSSKVKPFMKISDRLFDELLRLMVDYASKRQLHTENENLMKGKLLATEKHLEDMRALTTKLSDFIITAKK